MWATPGSTASPRRKWARVRLLPARASERGISMSERLAAYRRRLAKVEQQLATIAWRKVLANCTCDETKFVIVHSEEEQKAVLSVPCPAHGHRRIAGAVLIEYMGRPQDRAAIEVRETPPSWYAR